MPEDHQPHDVEDLSQLDPTLDINSIIMGGGPDDPDLNANAQPQVPIKFAVTHLRQWPSTSPQFDGSTAEFEDWQHWLIISLSSCNPPMDLALDDPDYHGQIDLFGENLLPVARTIERGLDPQSTIAKYMSSTLAGAARVTYETLLGETQLFLDEPERAPAAYKRRKFPSAHALFQALKALAKPDDDADLLMDELDAFQDEPFPDASSADFLSVNQWLEVQVKRRIKLAKSGCVQYLDDKIFVSHGLKQMKNAKVDFQTLNTIKDQATRPKGVYTLTGLKKAFALVWPRNQLAISHQSPIMAVAQEVGKKGCSFCKAASRRNWESHIDADCFHAPFAVCEYCTQQGLPAPHGHTVRICPVQGKAREAARKTEPGQPQTKGQMRQKQRVYAAAGRQLEADGFITFQDGGAMSFSTPGQGPLVHFTQQSQPVQHSTPGFAQQHYAPAPAQALQYHAPAQQQYAPASHYQGLHVAQTPGQASYQLPPGWSPQAPRAVMHMAASPTAKLAALE